MEFYESFDLYEALMGNFSALSSIVDRIGAPVKHAEITPMLECINYCDIMDVKATGRYFTWNNKQDGDHRMFSRIDRVLANNV